MCGIFGCVGKIDYDKAIECVQRLHHRGPDGADIKQMEGITLGHTRLAILDQSYHANQPMRDVSGRYWIIYNGEVYNFVEIKKQLELQGYRFRTQTDTEVLLYAYIEWGEEFQNKCNGMWALAIWDNDKKQLFLSRDRFGIKPLYIYRQDGNFYFASEMKAFFPVMNKKAPNVRIFWNKSLMDYEATDECAIIGITKLAAGNFAVLRGGVLNTTRWWNTLDHLVNVPRIYDEQVEMLRELFLDACKIRMRSDVPVGTALSGGIDSSCVVGAMNYVSEECVERKSNDWRHAFAAYMPDTICDEAVYAETAAAHAGIHANRVRITPCIEYDELLKYMYLCEDPYLSNPVPYMQTYHAIRQSGVKVTLDGHGADELFGGYPPDLFSAFVDSGIDTGQTNQIMQTYNEAVPDFERITEDRAMRRIMLQLRENERFKIQEDNCACLDEFGKRLYIKTHHSTLPTLLRCYDRFSMANGLEIRMPFMDHRIVSFAFSIPWSSKVRNGYTKAIVRDMARPFMSSEILNRKVKIGFNPPVTEWFKGEWKELLVDIICSKDFRECELVNALDICVDVNEFFQREHVTFRDGERIWGKIVPYLWKKAVVDCS